MISVIVPTLNSATTLSSTLESLISAAVQGLVREVLVVDGGSTDNTLAIADGYGATTISASPQRSLRLAAGVQQSRCPWLLVLNPDSVLEVGWEREAEHVMGKIDDGSRPAKAVVFRYVFDDTGFAPRTLEILARSVATIFGLAHAEQGLLIQRSLLTELGGYKPLPVLEDVDLTWRLGRRRLTTLRAGAVRNTAGLRGAGYARYALRYYTTLTLYGLHVPMARIAPLYGPRPVGV